TSDSLVYFDSQPQLFLSTSATIGRIASDKDLDRLHRGRAAMFFPSYGPHRPLALQDPAALNGLSNAKGRQEATLRYCGLPPLDERLMFITAMFGPSGLGLTEHTLLRSVEETILIICSALHWL